MLLDQASSLCFLPSRQDNLLSGQDKWKRKVAQGGIPCAYLIQ
jgi:hypothetical protein